jgi:stage II sporulation protein AA (anti-sigma F factor antagonist)
MARYSFSTFTERPSEMKTKIELKWILHTIGACIIMVTMLNIKVAHRESVCILTPGGSIEASRHISTLREQVDLAIKDHMDVLLNLEDVHYIDSKGLSEIIYCNRLIKQNERSLYVCSPGKTVQELFTLTRLDSIIPVFEEEEEALSELFKNNYQS